MTRESIPDQNGSTLTHYGVKGMKWGIRKEYEPHPRKKGVSLNKNGSISIQKGVYLQRLSRIGSDPLHNISYASVLEIDNAYYIKEIGGKHLLGWGRENIVSIKAKKDLKAPSIDEAVKIFSNLVKQDKEMQKGLYGLFGIKASADEISQIIKDPAGKISRDWYEMANVCLTYGPNDTDSEKFMRQQEKIRSAFLNAGYNIIRDENDAGAVYAPIILLDKDAVEVTSINTITKGMRKESKEVLRSYKKRGKRWIESQLY